MAGGTAPTSRFPPRRDPPSRGSRGASPSLASLTAPSPRWHPEERSLDAKREIWVQEARFHNSRPRGEEEGLTCASGRVHWQPSSACPRHWRSSPSLPSRKGG